MTEHTSVTEFLQEVRMQEEQREITWGDTWMTFVDHGDDILFIFGEVIELEPFLVEEKELGASKEEVLTIEKTLVQRMERHLVYSRCFSWVEPKGELGFYKKAYLWPISRDTFESARESGWKLSELQEDFTAVSLITEEADKELAEAISKLLLTGNA